MVICACIYCQACPALAEVIHHSSLFLTEKHKRKRRTNGFMYRVDQKCNFKLELNTSCRFPCIHDAIVQGDMCTYNYCLQAWPCSYQFHLLRRYWFLKVTCGYLSAFQPVSHCSVSLLSSETPGNLAYVARETSVEFIAQISDTCKTLLAKPDQLCRSRWLRIRSCIMNSTKTELYVK